MKKHYIDYGWLVVLFAILLIAMTYSILFGKREGFVSAKDLDVGHKLVFFYNENCKYCHMMMSAWDDAAEMSNTMTEKMMKVNLTKQSTENDYIKEKYNITAYPTIYLLRTGKPPLKYEHERDAATFISFVHNNIHDGENALRHDEFQGGLRHDEFQGGSKPWEQVEPRPLII